MKRNILCILIILLLPGLLYAALEVHFVDVGQGDAIIINADGHFGLIDGGPVNKSYALSSYLKNVVTAPFELVVVSHTDSDHVGGIDEAIKVVGLKKTCTIWCNDINSNQAQFTSFKKIVNGKNLKIIDPKIGTTKKLGKATIIVLGPVVNTGFKNDDSIVIRLEYADKSFLFMGDAERAEENFLINKYSQEIMEFGSYPSAMLKSDVLKVGHHGSRNSTTGYFLRYVMPSISVISVGANNRNGHPTEETLSRLIQANSNIFRTDIHGTVKICVSDSGMLTVQGVYGNKPWMDETLKPSYIRNSASILTSN